MSTVGVMNNTFYVLVFKTNLRLKRDVKKLKSSLDDFDKIQSWNIDWDDADKILRVETGMLCQDEIISLLADAGYHCEELAD